MKNLELLTHEDFEALMRGPNAEYYRGRWEYYKEVVGLVLRENPEKTVELGPGQMPIVKNGDVILNPSEDVYGRPEDSQSKLHVFDATLKSWPIADNSYDMFIALQVWEHLNSRQTWAFREVMRISKKAVLSFPYLWEGCDMNNAHDRLHLGVDMELIRDWTLGIKPDTIIEIERTGPEFSKGPRLICYWDFSK